MAVRSWSSEIREALGLLRRIRSDPHIGRQLKRSRFFQRVVRLVPPKFLRHYVYPLLAGRSATPYDAQHFFESFYAASEAGGVSDSATLSPVEDVVTSRYHYAVTEKAIIEALSRHRVPDSGHVLDVGSGAGHWIAFYRELLRPARLVGIDIARRSVEALAAELDGIREVEIRQADISRPDFELGEHFDLINAIGVMFHIVDDDAWERAIRNLARHLKPGGFMIVGGQFGWISANVQFHGRDDFASWDEGASDGPRLVNKRIRSYRRWKRAAAAAELRVLGVERTREIRSIYTPENNILVLASARTQIRESNSE